MGLLDVGHVRCKNHDQDSDWAFPLQEEVPWECREVRVMGRTVKQPRCALGAGQNLSGQLHPTSLLTVPAAAQRCTPRACTALGPGTSTAGTGGHLSMCRRPGCCGRLLVRMDSSYKGPAGIESMVWMWWQAHRVHGGRPLAHIHLLVAAPHPQRLDAGGPAGQGEDMMECRTTSHCPFG